MPFNDTSEGQTHYAGDGCQPPHVITSDSATPQPTTMEECQQYLAICKNCGRSQSAHAFAPPQSEERRETCQRCGKTFRIVNTTISCCVLHAPGECCHYGQIEVPSYPDTLRVIEAPAGVIAGGKSEEGNYHVIKVNELGEVYPVGTDALINQERERIDDKWGKAWAELVENTDKETKELKERWENELREKVLALGSYMDRDSEYQDDGVYRDEVLALISNKGKE